MAATPGVWEHVIGVEVHVELATASKIFCGCAIEFGAPPNTHVCPICLGLPGVLPVFNEQVLAYAARAALALGCRVPPVSQFARKNYFYPDLPKGYQITQFERSLAYEGELSIEADQGPRRVRIDRINIEEEAAKSLHGGEDGTGDYSLIDFNRAGVPLIEIVSQPDLRSAEEVRTYLTELRNTILYTGISDCRMQEGSFRFDVNVSIRPRGATALGTLVELKNLNSFRAAARAVEHEVERQAAVYAAGEAVKRETRSWDEAGGRTVALRSKEQSDDYRYFPEPDLPLLRLEQAYLERVRAAMPVLPDERRSRLATDYGLSAYTACVLVADKAMADFFDQTVDKLIPDETVPAAGADRAGIGVAVANWITGDLARLANTAGRGFDELPIGPGHLADLLTLISAGEISGKMAKDLLEEAWAGGELPSAIVAAKGLAQVSDVDALAAVVAQVLAEQPDAVQAYRGGKEKAFGFLVGQVMRATRGQANPGVANRLIRQALDAPDS